MSLIDYAMETCVFVTQKHIPDGYGGYTVDYTDGAEFPAAVTYNNSLEAIVAAKQGVTSLYTITTAKGVGLRYYELIKRKKDGKVLRITSNADDKQTPTPASFAYEQVTAEEYILS